MKEKLIECVEATRSHFKNKDDFSVPEYLRHFEKEMRYRDLNKAADIFNGLLKEKIANGGFANDPIHR